MAASRSSIEGMLDDYANLRTIPAILGIFFAVASLYQFGGLAGPVTLEWINYTLTKSHAMLGSIGMYAIAFASSETKQWAKYNRGEQALIAAGPVLIFGQQQIDLISTTMANNAPVSGMIGFVLVMLGWGVAVR